MSAGLCVVDFFRVLRQSGLLEEGIIRRYEPLAAASADPDCQQLAEQMVRDAVLTRFQCDHLLQGKWRGFHLGKYRILERIGSGGMGQVFLCWHIHLDKLAAIKVLPPSKASQPSALGRFYREARAAAMLAHPHLVRTYDVGNEGDLHYIVMDYIHGPNLLDVVKQFGPLSIERCVTYLDHVADALDYAYQRGLVHRDIKPGNILIDRSGKAYLLDMGLARFYQDESDNLTVMYDDKMVLGTADYVAPEQVVNSHAADIRADLYALGATAYYLLTGHPMFPEGSAAQKLIWHKTRLPTPIEQLRPDVPPLLGQIIAKMVRKEPEERYQTPQELRQALRGLVPATPPLPREAEFRKFCPLIMRLLERGGYIGPQATAAPSVSLGSSSSPPPATRPAADATLVATPMPSQSHIDTLSAKPAIRAGWKFPAPTADSPPLIATNSPHLAAANIPPPIATNSPHPAAAAAVSQPPTSKPAAPSPNRPPAPPPSAPQGTTVEPRRPSRRTVLRLFVWLLLAGGFAALAAFGVAQRLLTP